MEKNLVIFFSKIHGFIEQNFFFLMIFCGGYHGEYDQKNS